MVFKERWKMRQIKKECRLTIRLSEADMKKLDAISYRNCLSRSEMIRYLIYSAFNEPGRDVSSWYPDMTGDE